MIKNFEVSNFKCHEGNNYFDLPGLTVVTGTNNSGKSSLLQSIYLLTQTKTKLYPYLASNDELKLGGFSDVLNKNLKNTSDLEFSFSYETTFLKKYDVEELYVNLTYSNPSKFSQIELSTFESNPILSRIEFEIKLPNLEPENINLKIIDSNDQNIMYQISGKNDNGYCKLNDIIPEPIIYSNIDQQDRHICSLGLDRIRSILKMIDSEYIKYIKAFRVDKYADDDTSKDNVGLSGEFTAEILHKYWDKTVDFIDMDGKSGEKFSRVFDFWIKKILGENFRIRSTSLDKDKFKIILKDLNSGNDYSLNQVGFGISQILPIMTMLLTSKKEEVILIENPEVHLHPQLQSLFVDLCVFVLENDRKIIIETHSEHIINRIRYKIKENNLLLPKVNILFFEKNKYQNIICSEIEITEGGRISHWPKNFFDQTYIDLLGLIDQ